MRKIILCITSSLDQRIAEPDGSLDWLAGFPNPEKTDDDCKELLASVDTVIMGGKAYRELLNMDVIWPYPNQHTHVVSHHEWNADRNVSFITENIIETITELLNEPGEDILLAGGGELVSILLAADLIDEMQITYIPVILGNGVPLFPKQPKESKWRLLESKINERNNILLVKYRKE